MPGGASVKANKEGINTVLKERFVSHYFIRLSSGTPPDALTRFMTSSVLEPMSTTIQVRTDAELKKDVQHILSGLGLDLSTAINMYLSQIRQTGGIPFNVIVEKKVAQVKAFKAAKAARIANEQKTMAAVASAHKAQPAKKMTAAPKKQMVSKSSSAAQKKSFWNSILG